MQEGEVDSLSYWGGCCRRGVMGCCMCTSRGLPGSMSMSTPAARAQRPAQDGELELAA